MLRPNTLAETVAHRLRLDWVGRAGTGWGLAATHKVTERLRRRAPRPEPTRGRAQLAIEPRMLLALGGRANVANAFRPNKTQGACNEMGRATGPLASRSVRP